MRPVRLTFHSAEAALKYSARHLDAANKIVLRSHGLTSQAERREIDEHLAQYERGIRAAARLESRVELREHSQRADPAR